MPAYFIPSPDQLAARLTDVQQEFDAVGSDASAPAVDAALNEARQEAKIAGTFYDVERSACNRALNGAHEVLEDFLRYQKEGSLEQVRDLVLEVLHAARLVVGDKEEQAKLDYFTNLVRRALTA